MRKETGEVGMGIFARVAQSIVLMAVIGIGVIACSTIERPEASDLEQISITDVSSVAGRWEGALVQSPPSRRDDWVHLTIQPDGAYHFEAVRTIGVFSGKGKFDVENGNLVATTEKGAISFQLYRHSGKNDRVLQGTGRAANGMCTTQN